MNIEGGNLKSIFRNESKDIFVAVAALFSVNFVASVVGAAISVIQALFVTAEELGFFKQFAIISNYAFFLHLGTFHAIERLYPFYMGKGDILTAQKYVQAGNFWIQFVCIALTIVYLALGIYSIVLYDFKSACCWFVQIVISWTTMYGGYLSATFRSGKEFKLMAKAGIWNPLLQICIIPIYWIQPFFAMVARNCTSIVTTIRLHINRPIREKPVYNMKDIIYLIKEGLPLFSASYVSSTGLDAVRGTLVLFFLSKSDWGYWSFAYTIILLVLQLPTSINAVYQPRIISEYAKSGSIDKALKTAQKPILFGGIVMLIFVPISIVFTKILIPILLPNYIGAINLLVVLLCAVIFKLSDVFVSILNAAHKIIPLNIISIVCTIVQIGMSILFVFGGFGIVAFGLGFLVGYICRTLFLYTYILRLKRECVVLNYNN